MSQTIKDDIGVVNALMTILNQDKQAADPALTGVSGEPIPAEMVATGAEQMMPPPGAASGMPPQPAPGDPAAAGAPGAPGDPNAQPQAAEILMQLGMMIEQLGGQMLQVLTELLESQKRVERTMLMMAGNAMGPDAADVIDNPEASAPAAPKTAGVTGEFISAQSRDGVVSRDNSDNAEDLRTSIKTASSLAAAVMAIHQYSGN